MGLQFPVASETISSMKSLLALFCGLLLAFVLAMAFSPSSTEAASARMRRSVNFTPSWGKRSGSSWPLASNQPLASYEGQGQEACANRAIYLEMLAASIKVELESLADCLSEK